AMTPAPGNVSSQALPMLTATFQFTADRRRVEPTPITAAEMTCVEDTGAPRPAAVAYSTAAAVSSAAKPCGGSRAVTFEPRVRMMRVPPTAVPAESTPAHERYTHTGISWLACTPATLS